MDFATMDGSISKVEIKNLQLQPIMAANMFGIKKLQPTLASLSIEMKHPFTDGPGEDNLARSLNYGNLAKRLRAIDTNELFGIRGRLYEIFDAVHGERMVANRSTPYDCIVMNTIVTVRLPKASPAGDGFIFTWWRSEGDDRESFDREIIEISNLDLMVLIGINDYERRQKQRIKATLTVTHGPQSVHVNARRDEDRDALNIEMLATSEIENSSFETLEALASRVAKAILRYCQELSYGHTSVKIRLEKPKAIAFADAAVVEHTIIGK